MTERIDIDECGANWLHEARLKRKEKELKYDEKYYTYLDRLRDSAVTNMFGASAYLEQQFSELTQKEAQQILVDWMKTFGQRQEARFHKEVEERKEENSGQERD